MSVKFIVLTKHNKEITLTFTFKMTSFSIGISLVKHPVKKMDITKQQRLLTYLLGTL